MSTRKERKAAARKMIDAYTPWEDRLKAWAIKWMFILSIVVLFLLWTSEAS